MKEKSIMKILALLVMAAIFVIFPSLVIVSPTAATLGVGVSPEKIDFGTITIGESVLKELYIVNTGDENERIVIKAEKFGNITEFSASEFIIKPKESKLVNVTMSIPPDFNEGNYSGSLLVTSLPSDASGLNIGTAVRIPIAFSVHASLITWVFIGVCIVSGAFLSGIFFFVHRRKIK